MIDLCDANSLIKQAEEFYAIQHEKQRVMDSKGINDIFWFITDS